MGKKFAFYILMFCFTLVLLEALAFAVVQVVDTKDFFDSREGVYVGFTEASFADFTSNGADPVTGWRSFGPRVHEEENCLGELVESTYDAVGARIHSGFDPRNTEIVVVGDSYTNGKEANDDETFPARLSQILDISVANHGVGGYGPTQSLLNLQQNISRYPEVKVVVLAIMYENVHRMVNSYRPVLYHGSSNYTLKPYMAAGQIVSHPGAQAFDSVEQFTAATEPAFENDFWAKPKATFPYSLALFRSLSSNYFRYRKVQRAFRKAGKPEYFLSFDNPEIQLNLIAVLNQLADVAREWDVKPVVIFIPRNSLDTSSAIGFIARRRAELDSSLVIGDVAEFEGVDWINFNLREAVGDNICHPSPYGYDIIAQYIAQLLRRNEVSPAL
jgi:hypothetical protein